MQSKFYGKPSNCGTFTTMNVCLFWCEHGIFPGRGGEAKNSLWPREVAHANFYILCTKFLRILRAWCPEAIASWGHSDLGAWWMQPQHCTNVVQTAQWSALWLCAQAPVFCVIGQSPWLLCDSVPPPVTPGWWHHLSQYDVHSMKMMPKAAYGTKGQASVIWSYEVRMSQTEGRVPTHQQGRLAFWSGSLSRFFLSSGSGRYLNVLTFKRRSSRTLLGFSTICRDDSIL